MTVADTMTNSIRDMSAMADEKMAPVVLALNRQIFFTDVPCGAMKIRDSNSSDVRDDEDLPKGFARFCGGLERVFCFTDLKDVEETDLKRLRSMQSIGDKHFVKSASQSGTPVVETVDTESCSDDDTVDIEPAAEEPEPAAEAKEEAENKATGGNEDKKDDLEEVNTTVVRETLVSYSPTKTETAVLPPANTLQAATDKVNAGKPTNSLQAARGLKKEKQEALKTKKQEALKKEKQAKQVALNKEKRAKQEALKKEQAKQEALKKGKQAKQEALKKQKQAKQKALKEAKMKKQKEKKAMKDAKKMMRKGWALFGRSAANA